MFWALSGGRRFWRLVVILAHVLLRWLSELGFLGLGVGFLGLRVGCWVSLLAERGCASRALAVEMEHGGLLFGREREMSVWCRGAQVGMGRVDFLVEEVLVDCKDSGKGRVIAEGLEVVSKFMVSIGGYVKSVISTRPPCIIFGIPTSIHL